jgi:PAS domain S-box-containing protein
MMLGAGTGRSCSGGERGGTGPHDQRGMQQVQYMAAHSGEPQPKSADAQPLSSTTASAGDQLLHDIQAVNEQLLIAGLREQQLAEQLGHQLAFTTAITTSLAEGLYVLDTAGRCTFVNPAAEQMLGWTSDELQGKNISLVIPIQAARGASSAATPAPLLDVLRFGTTQRNEDALFVHHDGSMFPTAYSAAPIITDGQVVGAVVAFRDMTEVRRLQRTREEYLALISHDLRTPLAAILGRAEILLRRLTRQGLVHEADSAKVVFESSLRMNDMIEDLLDRSRTDADMQAQHRSEIDLVVVVQQMIDQTITPDDRTRVTFDAVPTLPVVIEVAQIERVIVNLLANALKFSSREYPIVVQVYQDASDAIIAVTDQGIGIAPEDLPQLFEKHYRADSVEQIAGSGLGLYSSRLIVEAHGGRLWVESTVGMGSTFTVALPLF